MLVQTDRLRQRLKIKLFYDKIDFLQVRKPVSGLAQESKAWKVYCMPNYNTVQTSKHKNKTKSKYHVTVMKFQVSLRECFQDERLGIFRLK
jgi:hypothetical protein